MHPNALQVTAVLHPKTLHGSAGLHPRTLYIILQPLLWLVMDFRCNLGLAVADALELSTCDARDEAGPSAGCRQHSRGKGERLSVCDLLLQRNPTIAASQGSWDCWGRTVGKGHP
jgi:hypothetical protein